MPYRNKCYACFDGDTDIHYYRLLTAWSANERFEFSFNDAHDLTQARDSSTEETIKRSLRTRLNNTREFLLLIGQKTKNLHRFVRWEIETALNLDIPIIAVNLNGKRSFDPDLCPPILRNQLAIHIPFGQKIIEQALTEWPELHSQFARQNSREPKYYYDSVYKKMGI